MERKEIAENKKWNTQDLFESDTAWEKEYQAVEKAYGRKFRDDAERVAFLFERYSELTQK